MTIDVETGHPHSLQISLGATEARSGSGGLLEEGWGLIDRVGPSLLQLSLTSACSLQARPAAAFRPHL